MNIAMLLKKLSEKTALTFGVLVLLFTVFLTFSPSSVYADSNSDITGSFQAVGQTVNFDVTVPTAGGAVQGSFSGACNGSVTGNFNAGANTITGNANGSCSFLGVTKSGSFNFSGSVNTTNNTLTIASVTRSDGSTPGSLQFVSLPITTTITITGNNNNSNNNGTQTNYSNIISGQNYSLSQNSNVSVNFTALPAGSNSVTLQAVDLGNGVTGYDISSNMTNGTFTYDLTLPIPAGVNSHNLIVKYASSVATFSNAQTVTQSITDNGNGTITIHGLNHFTVFVVDTNPVSAACIGAGANCYSTVQAAVNAASAGDTINVQAGTYNETVTVNKSLTFNGVGNPTITTMIINASPVTLNGLTVTNLTYPDTQAPVISNVSITNASVIKNGTSVTISATITDNNQSSITTSMITANLSALGGGAAVHPVSYNTVTGLATWAALSVSGTTNGLVSITINAQDLAGNNAVAQSSSVLTDNIAPAQATSVALTSQISSANQTNVTITGNGEVGATVNYTISNGVTNVSGTSVVSNTGVINITGINVSSLNEGTLTLSLTLTDTAGNTSTAATTTATKDTIAPVTTDNASNTWVNHSVTVTLACTDAAPGTGCAHTYYTTDGSTPTTSSTQGNSIVLSAQGVYTIKYFSVDAFGNTEGVKTAAQQVRIDLTNPTTSANNVIAGWYTANPTITLSSADLGGSGLNNVRYAWDSVANATTGTVFVNGTTINIPSDGVHTLNIYVDDVAGNSASFSAVYRLDTVNPVVSATNFSNNWVNAVPSIVVTGTDTLPGSGVASILYAWDGAASISITTGTDLAATFPSDGNHILNILITDVSGRTANFTGTYKVDRVAPVTSDNTDALWHTSPVTITLSCTDANSGCATTYYTTDGSTPTLASAQGTSIVLSADGIYTIKYFTVDVAGNTEGVKSAANQVHIDQTNPVTTDNTDLLWHNSSFTVNLNCTDNLSGCSQIVYTTDGTNPISSGTRVVVSASSASFTLSADGIYTIQYYSVDVAGNQEVTKSATVKVDKTNPVLSASGSSAAWYTANINITLNASDALSGLNATTVRYAWNSTANATTGTVFTNGTVINIPGDGSWTLNVYAQDSAGNVQTFTGTYMLDTVNPVVSATGASSSWQTSLPSMVVSATDATSGVATVTYQWDNGSIISTANGIDLASTYPSDGTHTLTLLVTDNSGRSSTFVGTYKIDRVAPVTSDDVDGLWHNTTVTVHLVCADTTSGCATTYYTTDGSTPTTASASGNTIVLSADGTYTIKYFSVDVAGNSEGVKTAVNQVKIDTIDPVVTSILLLNNTTGNNAYAKNGDVITLTSVITDANRSLITTSMITADLSAYGLGSAVHPTTYNGATGLATWSNLTVSGSVEGFAQVTVNVTDIAGNPGTLSSVTALVDNTAPVTTDNAPSGWHNSTVTVTLVCSDPTATTASGCGTTYYTTDGSTPTTNSAHGTSIVLSTNGVYTIKYFTIDNAGNIEAVKTAANQVMIDITNPVISGVSLANNTTGNSSLVKNGDSVTISATITDNNQSLLTQSMITANLTGLGGGAAVNPTTFNSVTGVATWTLVVSASGNGLVTITVNAVDVANNPATAQTVTTTADNTAPTATSVHIQSNNANIRLAKAGDVVTITFTTSENVQTPVVTIDGHAAVVTGSGTNWTANYTMVAGDAQGSVVFTVDFTDLAGNTGATVTAISDASSVLFDSVNPVTTDNIVAGWHNTPVTVTLSCTDSGSGCSQIVYTTDGSNPVTSATRVVFNGNTTFFTLNADGVYTIQYYSIDNAGNIEVTKSNTVMIDQTVPVISNVTLTNTTTSTNTLVKNGDTIVVTAKVTDNNQALLTTAMITADLTSLGGGAAVHPVSYNTLTGIATWAPIIVTGTTNGLVTITINSVDIANNSAVAQTASITADNIAPTLTSVSMTTTGGNPVNLNGTVTITFTASEAIHTPVVTIDGQSVGASNIGGNTWSATLTVAWGMPDGLVPFTIDFTDLAFNAGATATATTDGSTASIHKFIPLTQAGPPSTSSNSPAPTSAPVGINGSSSANTFGSNQVTLTWFKASGSVTNYMIFYGLTPAANQYGVPNTGNVTSYTIGGLTRGVTYYFRIVAVNNGVPGVSSQVFMIKVLPGQKFNTLIATAPKAPVRTFVGTPRRVAPQAPQGEIDGGAVSVTPTPSANPYGVNPYQVAKPALPSGGFNLFSVFGEVLRKVGILH